MRLWLAAIVAVLALACAVPAGAQTADQQYVPDACSGTGADADYAYCPGPGCRFDQQNYGADGQYTYCASGAAGHPPPQPKRATLPISAGTLPLTGEDPLQVALFGLAFLMLGAGLRLKLSRPVRSPSG